MAATPDLRIVRGSPTPEEEDAIRKAVAVALHEDEAKAARDPWVIAARADAMRSMPHRPGPDAWKIAARLS